jgi:predicted house-cleaning noncanonical NTP pyrophosphatase (MazG superfamily)
MDKPDVSTLLDRVIEIAKKNGDASLERWAHLELEGYDNTNKYMKPEDVVPEYRGVPGEHRDASVRTLLIKNPQLNFVNIFRIRTPVPEIEDQAGSSSEVLAIKDPERSKILREKMNAEVCEFVFSRTALLGVLTSIREEAIRRSEKYISREEFLSGKTGKGESANATRYDTLAWLWQNLPRTAWVGLVGLLGIAFSAGVYTSGIPWISSELSHVLPGYRVYTLSPEASRTVENAITELVKRHNDRLTNLQNGIIQQREQAASAEASRSYYGEKEEHIRQAEELQKNIDQETAGFERELRLLRGMIEKP